MNFGPDGSLSKITSTVKECCKIGIQASNDAQNSLSPLYKLVCIDAEKNQHESLSEASEDEMDYSVFELSDVTQDKERESINENQQQENLKDKGHAYVSIYQSNRDAQSSFSSSRSSSHKRRNAVRQKRNFRNNYKSRSISENFNVPNNKEISPWLTEDQLLRMSFPYNQLPFPVFGCPNESFIPNQLKPDLMTTGFPGDSPFSLLSRPFTFQELNQSTHGCPNFYYDKPVAARSGIPDYRHWIDRPIVNLNRYPQQPYWNNKPAPNQTTETMFWNKEQHSNWGVTNDYKYWNDKYIGPEPPVWIEGHPEGYYRPGPPDRKVHTQTKYHDERFQNQRNSKYNNRRWRKKHQKKQDRNHEWRKRE